MNFGKELNEANKNNLNKYGYIVYDLGATYSDLFNEDILNNFKTVLNIAIYKVLKVSVY